MLLAETLRGSRSGVPQQQVVQALEVCESNDIYTLHMAQTNNHLLELLNGEKQERPVLLWIGCSLDRYQINAMCDLLGGQLDKFYLEGSHGRIAASVICHAPQITMGYLQIFGMHHKCNKRAANQVDPRSFETEAVHIRFALPKLMVRMGETPTHVQVGSNLWDLSPECNHQLGVTEQYQEQYVQGIRDIHRVVADLLPAAQVAWRTGMPVHTLYDAAEPGRKLVNQKVLNDLVQEEVVYGTHHYQGITIIGSYLDHWSLVRAAPTDCCMLGDGRHYPACSSYAFFNHWLDQVFSTDGGGMLSEQVL